MKTIRIKLEYGCFPVWIYDEKNRIVDNDLPGFLEGDEVEEMFLHIQDVYDDLFLDNEKEFKYVGFKTDEEYTHFVERLAVAIRVLTVKLGEEYIVEENLDHLKRLKN